MTTHKWPILWLALLVTLSAAEAPASTAASHLPAGEVGFSLSTQRASTIPIDVQALAESLCGRGQKKGESSIDKCHLATPSGDPPVGTKALRLRTPHSPVEGPPLWQAAGLELSGEPVVTACGIWSSSLSLDETRSQPISPMVLAPAADDSGHRLFASVVEMRARLHLANGATGQAVDYPLLLGLGVAGSWSPASPDGTGVGKRDKSLRRLLIGKADDDSDADECLPVWVEDDLTVLDEYLALGCKVCTSDSP